MYPSKYYLVLLFCVLTTKATIASGSTQVFDIRVENVPVSNVVQFLRAQQCASVSFIEAAQAGRVSLDLQQVTVEEVLLNIAKQNPAYRSESIRGRDVLYPVAPEFQAILDHVAIQSKTRQAAVELYVDVLRKEVPALSNLVPPILFGDERRPMYSDVVSLRERGRVIEHFADLLGQDKTLYFEFIKARSGLPSLVFGRLPCAAPH